MGELRKVAAYNPETLGRIRGGATPGDLGWDIQFYSSVCRRHGIPVCIAPLPAVSAPRDPRIAEAEAARLAATGRCVFDPASGELRRGNTVVALSKNGASVFKILAKVPRDLVLMGSEIGTKLGVSREAGIARAYHIRAKLRLVRLELQGVKGPGGGFRLVEADSGDPAIIEFLVSKIR